MTFKQEYSNFRIVIVVDMWITGFDVPCLTYLYNDKPLQKHTLVQTVSRVNRKYPGKDFGYIIDYIGIRNNMMEAMKKYGGETFGPSEDDVQQALGALLVELELIKQIFVGFNLNPFIDKASKPLDRLECLGKASEHILTLSKMFNVAKESKAPKSRCQNILLGSHQASETAYDICQPSNVLNHEQLSLSQCFMCVATYIRKASGEKHDTESMNRVVQRMVAEALQCNSVVSILDTDVEESIFSPGFIEQLNGVKLPATRLEVLIKMLRKALPNTRIPTSSLQRNLRICLKRRWKNTTTAARHFLRPRLLRRKEKRWMRLSVTPPSRHSTSLANWVRIKKVSANSDLRLRRKPSMTS